MMGKSEYKKYENYFKRGTATKYVAAALLAVGLILLWVGFGYMSYVLMCVCFTVGLPLLLISTLGIASESDIDAYIESKTQGIEFKPTNPKLFFRRQRKYPAVMTEGNFDFSEERPAKRGKDGVVRSTEYAKFVVYPLDTAIAIAYRRVSLLSDEASEGEREIPYASLSNFRIDSELLHLSSGGGVIDVRRATLVVESDDGEQLLLPIHDDASTAEFVRKICELAREAKENI